MFCYDSDEKRHYMPASHNFENIEARNSDIRRTSKDGIWIEVRFESNILLVDGERSLDKKEPIFQST